MKKNIATKQIIIIVFIFLVMVLAIYAVFIGKILTQDETRKNVERGMIERLK